MDSFYNIAFYFLLIILFAVAVILFAGIFIMADSPYKEGDYICHFGKY